MRIPELTVRLQNLQVQYSPGSIPIPGTTPAPVIIQGVLGKDTLVSWFGVLLVMVTRMDVLKGYACAFELIFSWRYQECMLVSRFK